MALTAEDIKQEWRTLAREFAHEWHRMHLVESWYVRNKDVLKPLIYEGILEKDWGAITIYKNTIAATVDSLTALAIQPEPRFTALLYGTRTPSKGQKARMFERAMYAMRSEINRNRPQPWEYEVTKHAFLRGAIIARYAIMDQEERGEVREPITAEVAAQLPEEEQDFLVTDEANQQFRIVEEGEFPGHVEVIDPLECVYVLGPGRRGVVKFIHRTYTTWQDLVVNFPGIENRDEFSALKSQGMGQNNYIVVHDYWDEEQRAILVGNQFIFGPEKHNLRHLPIVVERIKEQQIRVETTEMADGTRASTTNPIMHTVTPYPWPMIDDVTKASFAESLLASYLPDMVMSPIIHKGISTGQGGTQPSPYFRRVRYRDESTGEERIEPVPRYRFRADKSIGGRQLWPGFDGEEFYPLNPVPIADHLMVFNQQRQFDLAQVGVDSELLSGRIQSEPSGLSVNQQIQLSSARTNDYVNGRNRFVSRVYTGLIRDLAENWDRGSAPMILYGLTNEDTVEVTQEDLRLIREIRYEIDRIFPRDDQADKQMAFQAHAQGAMTLYQLMVELGKEDPDTAIKRLAWERVMLNDPRYMLALAGEHSQELGVDPQLTQQIMQDRQGAMQQMLMAQMAQQQQQQPQPEQEGEGQQNGQASPEMAAQLAAILGNSGGQE